MQERSFSNSCLSGGSCSRPWLYIYNIRELKRWERPIGTCLVRCVAVVVCHCGCFKTNGMDVFLVDLNGSARVYSALGHVVSIRGNYATAIPSRLRKSIRQSWFCRSAWEVDLISPSDLVPVLYAEGGWGCPLAQCLSFLLPLSRSARRSNCLLGLPA